MGNLITLIRKPTPVTPTVTAALPVPEDTHPSLSLHAPRMIPIRICGRVGEVSGSDHLLAIATSIAASCTLIAALRGAGVDAWVDTSTQGVEWLDALEGDPEGVQG